MLFRSALKAFTKKENVAVFEKAGVFSARELESRYEIAIEDYTTKVMIEGNCALDMARTMIAPVVKAEYRETMDAYVKAREGGIASGTTILHDDIVKLGAGLDAIKLRCSELEAGVAKKDPAAVIAAMTALRTNVDALEGMVADDKWPLPKYREMLFLY